MARVSDIASDIMGQLPTVKSGSLVVFGDIFGGRIDNIHTIISAEAAGQPEHLIVRFKRAEVLKVWDPVDVVVNENEFRIGDASAVRWEWFYYGRPQTEANRRFIEHVKTGNRITVTNRQIGGKASYSPDPGRPAVELLAY